MQGRHALFVEYTSTPIRERGSLLGAVIVFRDITQRRESEERLRTALAEVDRLSHYAWPGNVREFENAIERAAVLAVRGQLRFDLPTIGAPLSAVSRLRAGEPPPPS